MTYVSIGSKQNKSERVSFTRPFAIKCLYSESNTFAKPFLHLLVGLVST